MLKFTRVVPGAHRSQILTCSITTSGKRPKAGYFTEYRLAICVSSIAALKAGAAASA